MDGTREGELKRLHEVFNNPLKSRHERRLAHDTFNKILRQVKDKHLTELRRRLIRAHNAEGVDAAEKITDEIDEYSRRMGYKQRLQHKHTDHLIYINEMVFLFGLCYNSLTIKHEV